jgi:phosphoglycolate phosphatase
MLALFDIDGTLIRTGGAGGRALARAVHGLHGWPDALRGMDLSGQTDPAIIEAIFVARRGHAPTPEEVDRLLEAYLPLLAEELQRAPEKVRVLPGVDAAIRAALALGALVGLATGNVEPAARHKLEAAGLWTRFGFGGYGSDAHARAELVARAIARGEARLGRKVDGREVVVIGDTPLDVAAAHACGARSVAVATGGASMDDLRASGAHLVIETLDELVHRLPEILR